MQDRLNQNDVTNRVNVENPANVREAVLRLFAVRYAGADFAGLEHAFDGFPAEAPLASRLVHFTGYEMDPEDIRVADPRDRMIGCMVGTADLIGQMSDRMYLEKVREFLYDEFVWGRIARERLPDGREIVRYSSADDLIIKTPGFYEYVARTRIAKKLDGADRYAESHFDGPSLYQSELERNMEFLRETIETADLARLRRYCYSLSAQPRQASVA